MFVLFVCEGIEIFVVGIDIEVYEMVVYNEIVWFYVLELIDLFLFDEYCKMVFLIVLFVFKDDNKWCLYDGMLMIYVMIIDVGFLLCVNNS